MKSRNYLVLMAATAVMASLAGCGGGGSNNTTTPTDTVPFTGGVSTVAKTDTPAVAASPAGTGTATEYTTTIGGASKTVAIVASTEAFAASTPIAIIPDNVPIIKGTIASRAPRDLQVTRFGTDGVSDVTTRFSNIVTSSNGSIVIRQPVGMLPGEYFGTVEGPITISGTNSKVLTVGNIGFRFTVSTTGVCSFPTSVTGVLPVNGGQTGSGGINVGITSNAGAGGSAYLSINAGSLSVTQSGELNSLGSFTFRSTKGGFTVPATGVDNVEIDVYPPTP